MSPGELNEGWAVVGNYTRREVETVPIREGAKCYLSHDTGLEQIEVLFAPKGKRWARFWTTPKRLLNLRIERVTCPRGSKLAGALNATSAGASLRLESLHERGASFTGTALPHEEKTNA